MDRPSGLSPESMVKLKIDDIETTVKEGTLIIEAARGIGIEIPHFCYHPKLSIQGSCRMCLVEVEGIQKLVTACTTPVTQNMIVRARSKKAKEAQEAILAQLLINHPLDCPVCDKGGECPLQDYTYRYGPGKSEFYNEKWHFKKPVDLSPLIVLDRERCILCTRCVRFQDEVAFHPQLEILDRGRGSFIETSRPEGFTSNFSGNTIEICPVGALTSRPFRFKARPWELKRNPSICPHCGCGCNIYLDIRENKVMRVLVRENLPVDDGWLCDRGRFGYLFVNHPDRLRTPLIKKGDDLVQCTWDDAIRGVVEGFKKAMNKYGGEGIGGLASPRLTNEDLYIFQKFIRGLAGSDHIAHSIDGGGIIVESLSASCAGLRRFSFQDIDEADSIFLIEGDPSRYLPILDLRIKKAVKRGARLYIASPEEIELSSFASDHIEFVSGNQNPPSQLLKRGGVIYSPPLAKGGKGGFERVFLDEIRNSKRCVILLGGKTDPSEVEFLCTLLKELYSNRGEGWISLGVLMPEANTQGAQDMGMVSQREGSALDKIRCLFVARLDIKDITSLRNRLDFLAVYDLFLTDTARVSDVVLPATSFSEVDGTFTNTERRVQRLFKTTRPPGDAKSLWEAIMLMANDMGAKWAYRSSEDVMREISREVSLYKFITYDSIGMKGSYADGTATGPRCYG